MVKNKSRLLFVGTSVSVLGQLTALCTQYGNIPMKQLIPIMDRGTK